MPIKNIITIPFLLTLISGCIISTPQHKPKVSTEIPETVQDSHCTQLHRLRNITIIYTDHVNETSSVPAHCYAKGLINGSITFHIALPVTDSWNGRLVHLGDGGADGDLDMYPEFISSGYAVVNSNTGHDTGAEPRAYAFRNERSAIDFSYWAVHTTTTAAKTVIAAYYGKPQDYAYHYGCSTGGRQALLAAQLFPYDFDGIVAGAAAHRQFHRMAHRLNLEQQLFRNQFKANLAFDLDNDGRQESLTKLNLLASKVMDKCDSADGIVDDIIEPPFCDFKPDRDLANEMCPKDVDADNCFTSAQLESINLLYEGSRNSKGELIYPGAPPGSELSWSGVFLPHLGNNETPYILRSASAVIGYSFFSEDPGLIPPNLNDTSYQLDEDAAIPEWGWWTFNIDDVGTDKMARQAPMMEGNDPDLDRFLIRNKGKLLMYHGWADSVIPPEPSLEYHEAVINTVFNGDADQAAEHIRLFMMPGVSHCRGGVGPDRVDYLGTLDKWVATNKAPESLTSRHFTDGKIDNERIVCPYPQRAVYVGPTGGQNEAGNWVAKNFRCEAP